MLYLIEPDTYDEYREDLDNMYRFRHKVFFDKLNWDVNSEDGMEKDQYDEKETYYLIYKDEKGIVRGCVRFIEMVNECMFDDPFKDMLPNVHEFKRPGYWEVSRFAIDTKSDDNYKSYMQTNITKMLITGVIEFGLISKKVECYLATSYSSIKRLYTKYGLIIYDLSQFNQSDKNASAWAFSPLTYSLSRLTNSLENHENNSVILNYYSYKSECIQYFS